MAERLYYIATCQDCKPILPIPFFKKVERDKWESAHVEGTGHIVTRGDRVISDR